MVTRHPEPDATILVVDDEPRLLRLVRANLERVGHRVHAVGSGEEALAQLERVRPDLIVLDLMMPGMDGYEVLERLRAVSSVPVILLTAKSAQADKMRGFELGADDYLTKPFDPEELLARVRAVLRRTRAQTEEPSAREPVVVVGDLRIDFDQRRVTRHGEEIKLSPIEFKLLQQLANNIDKVMLHEELIGPVWGPEYRDEIQRLWLYIRYLRQKLEDDPAHPRYLLSAKGIGYTLRRPPEEAPR